MREPAPSKSSPPVQRSWRNPGFWRLAYASPWVVLAIVLAGVTLGSSGTWFGLPTLGGIVAALGFLALAPLPAVAFLLVQGKGRLFTVAALGILHAFVLLLAFPSINQLVLTVFLAAVVASLIAIVVLIPWDVPIGEG